MAPRKPTVAPRRPPSLTSAPTPEQLAEQERREQRFIAGGAAPGVSQTPTGHSAGVSQTPKPRAAAGSAVLFERKRGPAKRRCNVYFREAVFARLEEYCARTGDELSRFIDAAVEDALIMKDDRE